VTTEKAILEDKLAEINRENDENVAQVEHKESYTESLDVELKIVDPVFDQNNLECDTCGECFPIKFTFNKHERKEHEILDLKQKELKLQMMILEEKYTLSSTLTQLNQTEVQAAKNCNCRKPCKIFHKIYNWQFSHYQSIVEKFTNLYSCSGCEKTFRDSDSSKTHFETVHQKTEGETGGK